jgi:hypothetical protein
MVRLYIGGRVHHTHQNMSGRGSSLLLHKGGPGAGSSFNSLEEYKEAVVTPSSYSKHLPTKSHKPVVLPAPMKGVGVRAGTLSGLVNRIRQGAPEERTHTQDKKLRDLVKQIEHLQLSTPKNTHKPKPISF